MNSVLPHRDHNCVRCGTPCLGALVCTGCGGFNHLLRQTVAKK